MLRLSVAQRTNLAITPDQADTYLDDIDRTLNGLTETPFIGADCSDITQGVWRLITGRRVANKKLPHTAVLLP